MRQLPTLFMHPRGMYLHPKSARVETTLRLASRNFNEVKTT